VSKEEAIQRLRELARPPLDEEVVHPQADDILLALINDPEIEEAYNDVPKWYE
jgi:hypothetical protein